MSGEWIKMRTSLLTNPKVNGIARILEESVPVTRALSTGYTGPMAEIVTRNVMRHVTVSSLLVIWGSANEHTRDGVFINADLSDIDDMVGIPGFAFAMSCVGWLEFDEKTCCVTLPNFDEYNTSGSERTAGAKSAAQRQKEYRERKKQGKAGDEKVTKDDVTRDVTNDVTRNRREEKRREEDSVAKATAETSSAKDRLWAVGIAVLGEKGRSLLGQLVKQHGEEVVDRAVASMAKEQPGEPKAWLVKACEAEAKVQRKAEQLGTSADLFADPKPQWALDAGFGTRFEAENEGCTQRNCHLFRDGRRMQ